MTDQVTAEQLQYLRELRKKRPEVDRAINSVCATHGADSLYELARSHLVVFDALFDGLWSMEEEVGDGEPDAPNWS